jgi:hypothetical protein
MTWTLKEQQVINIRSAEPSESWNVRKTLCKRSTTCRSCGRNIKKGDWRLTFNLLAAEWQRKREGPHPLQALCTCV